MMCCSESAGSIQRTVSVTIKPTPTELAIAIWELSTDEQITLLRCLARKFCRDEPGALQLVDVANELDAAPVEKAEEARMFVKFLDEYLLEPARYQPLRRNK